MKEQCALEFEEYLLQLNKKKLDYESISTNLEKWRNNETLVGPIRVK